MIKVITNWLDDGPTTSLMKIASGGLRGHDRRQLLKRASATLLDQLDGIERRPGEELVHMVAIGASERYGPNRNGDGFTARACRDYHDTFQKHARWYHDHCFTAGTEVVMADRRRVGIETVNVGDKVATSDGARTVTRVMCRPYVGAGVCLRVEGSLDQVTCTEEHPVLVIRKAKLLCPRGYCCLSPGEHQQLCRKCRELRPNVCAEYVPAASIEPDDYVLISRPVAGSVSVRPEFAELVGWVASEGYINKTSDSFLFTFSTKNTADIAAVRACLLANGVQTITETVRPDGLTQLAGYRPALVTEVTKYVYGVRSDKRLTGELLDWDKDSLLRFLGAYVDGDGSVTRKGKLRIRSSSRHVLRGLADVLHAICVPVSLNWDCPVGQPMVSPTNGKTYFGRGSGVVVVGSAFSPEVCHYSRKQRTVPRCRRPMTVTWGNFFLRKVKAVDAIHLDEAVFNLEVEDVHHYFAGEFVVHNCNKNPAKSYGIVKLSGFNEEMSRIELIVALNATKEAAERNGGLVAERELEKLASGEELAVSMACGLAGTLVKVDCGFKPIEKVQVGDKVLTHTGQYREVSAAWSSVKPSHVEVRLKYAGRRTLRFTPDHLFLTARWEDVKATGRKSYAELSGGSCSYFHGKYRDSLHTAADWRPCGELKTGDFLLMPIPVAEAVSTLSVAEARLLGYYLSEGWLGAATVGFTCHKNDAAVQEIPQLVEAGVTVKTEPHPESELAVNIRVFSTQLVKTCEAAVGRGAKTKHVPQVVFNATRDAKLAFASTWFNGDGWQDVKGLHWSTCSESLAIELQMLLASAGVPASVYRIDHTSDLPHGVKRNGVGTEYTVNVSNRYSEVFSGISKATRRACKTRVTAFITGNYLALPVESVTAVAGDVTVYDLSVKEDHSFTAFGMAVHNCHVAYDVCSVCGNRARNRAEYCHGVGEGGSCPGGGAFHKIGTILPDGRQLYVDNPHPKFFDISWVPRPADRIAYTTGLLTKAASFEKLVSGAALAEQYGLDDTQEQAWLDDRTAPLRQLVVKLAETEAALSGSVDLTNLAFAPAVQGKIDWNVAPLPYLLKAAVDRKVVLPLDALFALSGVPVEKVASAKAALPWVYRSLYRVPTAKLAAAVAMFKPDRTTTREAEQLMAKAARDYSWDSRDVDARIVRASLYEQPRPLRGANEKMATAADDAIAYAAYQLAMIQQMGVNDFFLQLAVRQNGV